MSSFPFPRLSRFLPELVANDLILGPDLWTWARRTLPPFSDAMPFLDWYPLIGAGRSRVSESDGVCFYGRSY